MNVCAKISSKSYYPFGMVMPGRSFSTTAYKWGFNGKEKDDEVSGSGNQYDYGFRIYNPRIAKFLSVDPLTKSYPSWSPYPFAMNRPIDGLDIDGLEWIGAFTWGREQCWGVAFINKTDNTDLTNNHINIPADPGKGGYSDFVYGLKQASARDVKGIGFVALFLHGQAPLVLV